MLELDLLTVFAAVADRGGFTRAAAALNRSQSAVSMQIKRLEDVVGSALFVRNGKHVHLSPEGEALIGYARRILALGDEAMGAIRANNLAGKVQVGCIDDYAARILPNIIASFWRTNPGVQVEVRTGLTGHLLDRLGIDYSIVLAMHPAGAGRGEVVCRDTPVWATSAQHPVHRQNPVPLALYPEGCLFRRWATSALDERQRPWRYAYLSSSLAAVEAAVEEGLAVSVFKRSMVPKRLRRLGENDGFPDLPDIDITLHLAPGPVPRPAMRLAEHIAECLGSGLGSAGALRASPIRRTASASDMIAAV